MLFGTTLLLLLLLLPFELASLFENVSHHLHLEAAPACSQSQSCLCLQPVLRPSLPALLDTREVRPGRSSCETQVGLFPPRPAAELPRLASRLPLAIQRLLPCDSSETSREGLVARLRVPPLGACMITSGMTLDRPRTDLVLTWQSTFSGKQVF